MYKKKKLIKLLPFFLIILFSCSKNDNLIKKPEKVLPLNILYKKAYLAFENSEGEEAIKLFQKVETNYSYSEWAPKATLMITYIYYDSAEYPQAIKYANKFKKNYQGNASISYAEYIIALCLYEEINVISKDQTNSNLAKRQFEKIIKKYPNSFYAEDAKYKIDLINEQLAGKHMYLARYYMEKSKWTAAILRLKIIEKEYANTVYIEEALHRFVEIYYKLGNIKEAKKYASLLGYNFNHSDWYKKTYKIIKNPDYPSIDQKRKKKFKDYFLKIFNFKND